MLEIAGRAIGEGNPCLVIAEAGVNHNGSVEMAKRLVDAACTAGADAVKFQTFVPELVMHPDAPKAGYQQETTGSSGSQLDMVRGLALSDTELNELHEYSTSRPIIFLSTPFDEESLDLLAGLGVPALKVASGEITNWPFLEKVASKGLPVILSTGMSTQKEVEDAVAILQSNGGAGLALLHCLSCYPASPADMNLRAIPVMARNFGLPVGLSDHSPGFGLALAAVALGAAIVEKHITLDRNLAGPDHRFSLEPHEVSQLVSGIRDVESAMGSGLKEPAQTEVEMRTVARRSLFLAKPIRQGEILRKEHLIALRPASGLAPNLIDDLVGKAVTRDLAAGEMLDRDHLA